MPTLTMSVGQRWKDVYPGRDLEILLDRGITLPKDDSPFKSGIHCKSPFYGDTACQGICWGTRGSMPFISGKTPPCRIDSANTTSFT